MTATETSSTKLYTIPEVADIIGKSTNTVYRLIREGSLAATPTALGFMRVRAVDLEAAVSGTQEDAA